MRTVNPSPRDARDVPRLPPGLLGGCVFFGLLDVIAILCLAHREFLAGAVLITVSTVAAFLALRAATKRSGPPAPR